MLTRALDRVFPPLTLVCVIAAAAGALACVDDSDLDAPVCGNDDGLEDCEDSGFLVPIDLGVDGTIIDLDAFGYRSRMAITADRDVMFVYRNGSVDPLPTPEPELSLVRAGALIRYGQALLVGDDGLVLRPNYYDDTWTLIEAFTDEDLIDVATINLDSDLVAVSTKSAFSTPYLGYSWDEVPAPEGGWGELRGVFSARDRVWLFGADGVLWSTETDEEELWVREDLGSEVDIIAGSVDGLEVTVAASDRVFTGSTGGPWVERPTDFDSDIIGFSAGFVITSTDEVRQLSSEGGSDLLVNLDFVPTKVVGDKWAGLLVGGEDGNLVAIYPE